jgi:unsaturated rhamnogalacturonyl hydrolase
VRFADTVMATWPDPATIDPAKNGWEYNTGIVLFGMSKVYEATRDPRYLDYIRRWVDGYVDEQGRLGWDQTRTHNLDYIQPGMLILFLRADRRGMPGSRRAVARRSQGPATPTEDSARDPPQRNVDRRHLHGRAVPGALRQAVRRRNVLQ